MDDPVKASRRSKFFTKIKFEFDSSPFSVEFIQKYFDRTIKSYEFLFQNAREAGLQEILLMSSEEIDAEKKRYLRELELNSSLVMLAAVEAEFKIDFMIRVADKLRDELSCRFQEIFSQKGSMKGVSLEKDIFDTWHNFFPTTSVVIRELKGVMNYRHWLAHGRFWKPNLARSEYDFSYVSTLADTVLCSFPFKKKNRKYS
jgi:hypothetical protein